MLSMNRMMGAFVIAATGLGSAVHADSSVGTYFIGVDNAETIGFGAYEGLANTNQNRLTLLFHHGNHFHGIGTHSYTGDPGSATPSDTSSNNRLPEGYTGMAPISLQAGTDGFAGTFRSGMASSLEQDQEYGDLMIRNVHSLNGVDDVIYNSSGGRWNTAFDNSHIHMVLLNATDGLKIAFGDSAADALQVGGDFHVGDGDEMFEVLPTFWVEGDAAIGSTYTAEFLLSDLEGNYENSGRFFLDFQVIPSPGALALVGAGVVTTGMRRRRQN